MRKFLWMAAIGILMGSPAGFAQQVKSPEQPQMDSILASVNGTPITLVDILPGTQSSEYRAYAVYSGARLEQEIRMIRRKAVDDRVDKLLVLEAFHADPFPVPAQAVEEELDKIAERMGVESRSEFARKLKSSGTSLEKLRKEVEDFIIVQIMISNQVRIKWDLTPQEVFEYYRTHRQEFVRPEKLGLAMILLANSDPKLKEKSELIAKKLAESPDSFAELAKKYSTGPDADHGGDLGEIERKRLRAEFAAAMPELKPGRVYGPVKTAEGITFLRILSHTPEEKGDFKALSPEIRNRLDLRQRNEIRKAYLAKLRTGAIIRYYF